MTELNPGTNPHWLALNIGNSRLHWALFQGHELQQTWNTPHLTEAQVDCLINHSFQFETAGLSSPPLFFSAKPTPPPLWIASAVPSQAALWQPYSPVTIELSHIPLQHLYATLGIDRALSLWGAIQEYGSPALVIDCGTALTLTGADAMGALVGGAILPGLQLQFRAVGQGTAALPALKTEGLSELPSRWARNTNSAIQSGVLYTTLGGIRDFIQDWRERFAAGPIVLTGGDAPRIHHLLAAWEPTLATQLQLDGDLAFWGMRSVREHQQSEALLP